jgi:hypothetical protein
MTLSLQFGLQPPAAAIRAWGARAILQGTYIDLLHDRQDVAGERNNYFEGWLNTVGLPWLRNHVERIGLRGSEYQRVAHVDGRYAIAANTNSSYGYLYIVAYEVADGEVPDEVDTPTPAKVVHLGEVPHAYVAPTVSYFGKACEVCYGNKSAPIHKTVKATRGSVRA